MNLGRTLSKVVQGTGIVVTAILLFCAGIGISAGIGILEDVPSAEGREVQSEQQEEMVTYAKEAVAVVENLYYIYDTETDICYAVFTDGNGDGTSITVVPYDQVKGRGAIVLFPK